MSRSFSLADFREEPLPTEEEIISGWSGDLDQPVISVLCHAYNHEDYIADAIRGFLSQVTTVPFEVILHDDASTDDTAKIIREYVSFYPRILKPVIQEQNQCSQGARPSLLSYPFARGQFLALCEGDDFWVSREKLEVQWKVMNQFPLFDMCFTAAFTLGADKDVADRLTGFHGERSATLPIKALIKGGGAFCPTATLMFRRSVYDNLESWIIDAPMGDYFLQVIGARKGGARYLPQATAVYRTGVEGSWSARSVNDQSGIDNFRTGGVNTTKKVCKLFESDLMKHQDELLSFIYYGAARRYLRCGAWSDFQNSINKSWAHKSFFSFRQSILRALCRFPRVLRQIAR